ncbi:MAG: ComF family protein [Clostridia bacterium]|nr:ComF family protein [Clostridia bacterium]
MKNLVKDLFLKVKNFLYGKNFTCLVCGRDVFDGACFCQDCKEKLAYNTVYRVRCGRKIIQSGYCADCRQTQPKFDKARSLFVYEGEVKNLIYRLKNGEKSLAKSLAEAAMPVFTREFSDADILTFVPMTKEREQERGYNQSRLLAEAFAEKGKKTAVALFEKRKETAEQKALTKAERQKNLQGSFHLKERAAVKDKRGLIVDDTLTTGATTEELAALLHGAGVKKVYVFTVASVFYQKNKGETQKI